MTIENRDALGLIDGEVLYGSMTQNLFKASMGNGVLGNAAVSTTSLKVDGGGTANMIAYVNPGICFINGSFYNELSTATLTVSTGHATLDRWDAVVYDQSASTSKIVAGTASSNPVIPDVDDDNDIYLAAIYVDAAEETAIVNADIYDLRAFRPQFTYVSDYLQHSNTANVAHPTAVLSKAKGIRIDGGYVDNYRIKFYADTINTAGTVSVYADGVYIGGTSHIIGTSTAEFTEDISYGINPSSTIELYGSVPTGNLFIWNMDLCYNGDVNYADDD